MKLPLENTHTMKIIKKYFTFFILVLPLFSYTQKVENIHFEQVGKQIHIYYDLMGGQTYTIQVFCSTNNGKTWGNPLQNVIGDVGVGQTGGINKKIIWEVLSEMKYLTGKVIFKIEVLIPFSGTSGTFIDSRDGSVYKWKRIGNQVWMVENLNVGIQIKGRKDQRDNNKIEKYCYNDLESNCDEFGGLFQWGEMMQYASEGIQGICPDGWHLPSREEWEALEMALGMPEEQATATSGWQGSNEGSMLKEGGSTGFNALMSGWRTNGGSFAFGDFQTTLWSSTTSSSFQARARTFAASSDKILHAEASKELGNAVRCLRD